MISQEFIKKLALQHQTAEENIAREYLQHVFLSNLYMKKQADALLFKGGTALRIIYQSPRFSEDLDFTGKHISKSALELLLEETLGELERGNLPIDITEAKETTGGYLGIIKTRIYSHVLNVKLEISFRTKSAKNDESTMIENRYIPSYNLIHLSQKNLIQEKINALLEREKARDFFDLYFILRANLYSGKQTETLQKIKQKVARSTIDFKNTLERFLPKSHHRLLKDFKNNLTRELDRYRV